ncbi:MAG: pantoate--beta-alanine ligase [Pseudomonadota bacterium]
MPDTPAPIVIRELDALRAEVGRWRANGERIGLVPTMGALHPGHIALITAAAAETDRVIVSIFVNPTQFAPNEDFETYPRTFDADIAALRTVKCDAVWAPRPGLMYPDGFATTVQPGGPAEGLESDFRPEFFAGVATVCTKLFIQCAPDTAVFGEKDYQQLAVIRTLVRDLNLPMTILGVPTVRETSGLAMSSRNAYLSDERRAVAAELYVVLKELAGDVRAGKAIAAAERGAKARLLERGFSSVDYVAVRHHLTLAPLPANEQAARLNARILAAVWLDNTRLIDNIPVANLDGH